VIYHFGSYTHPQFEKNPHYHIKSAVDSFMTLLPLCERDGILFVYPSSALIYELLNGGHGDDGSSVMQFAKHKKTLEMLATCYSANTLGVRIFPTYGPGENRTFISQCCNAIANDQQPVVYGDGTQTRDFIFITDAVQQILTYADNHPREHGRNNLIVDIGAGRTVDFNDIIDEVNMVLGKCIAPRYVPAPTGYLHDGVLCMNPAPAIVALDDGIRRTLDFQRKCADFDPRSKS